ncbi:MAG TPA: DUF6448 family protein [Thermoanaerobaculia bacterium]
MRASLLLLILLFTALPAAAHCDWINGPVVADARAALAAGDVRPVLKWIPPADEKEVTEAFAKTQRARAAGGDAREIADRWFFETVVRLHRASEGFAYSGLRGEEYTPDAGIMAAEKALESGSLEKVEKELSAMVTAGLRERFAHARHTREEAAGSVAAGRESVHAYAEFLHYVQGLHAAAKGGVHHEE